MNAEDGNDESTASNGKIAEANTAGNESNNKGKKISLQSRAGGRRRRQPKNNKASVEAVGLRKGKGLNVVIVVAFLAFVLSLSKLLGGGGNDPSYVYYQSTVFESTIVREDGRRETARKESIRSNLPELVRQQQQQESLDGTTTRLLQETDDEAQRVLNDAMEMQRRLWNDWFY